MQIKPGLPGLRVYAYKSCYRARLDAAMSGRKITESEFKEILQRAAELDDAEKPEFTPGDLREAARELGVSQTALDSALNERLAANDEAAALAQVRPHDTAITLRSVPNSLSLTVPPLGVRGGTLAGIGASLFGICFMAFWTWGAAHAGGVFALFSILGWIACLRGLAASIAQMAVRTELTLTRQKGMLTRRIGPFAHRAWLDPLHLTPRLDEGIRTTRGSTTRNPYLELGHGTQTYDLLTGFSAAEQEWVLAELRRWLKR